MNKLILKLYSFSLGNLRELHLGGNMIERLDAKTFFGLKKLEKLFLLSNNIEVSIEAYQPHFRKFMCISFHIVKSNLSAITSELFKKFSKHVSHLSFELRRLDVL